MEAFHGTTILSVRRHGRVVLGGDGQVTLGNMVMKRGARKVRRLHHGKVLAGFAGATADAFTLFIPGSSPAPPWNWPRTGVPIVCCGGSKPCWRWPTRKPR
jgi:hypothetical protein